MLQKDTRIALVGPGGAVSPEALEPGIAWLRSCGWVPVAAPHLHERHRYLAGRPEVRAADLEWALTAPDIDAVWFARGGYGTAQVLASLPWERLRRRPVIGFSDATALVWALARRGIESIHGPVLTTLGPGPSASDEESRAVLRHLLTTGEAPVLPGTRLCGPERSVRGRVVGGNLTVLASLAGTPEAFRAEGAIVVLEDVTESPYRLERALCQLIDSGGLQGAVGIALGEFVGCEPPRGATYELTDMWSDKLGPLGIPVIHQLPVGHGSRNHAFHYGGEAVLSSDGLKPVGARTRVEVV